MAALLPGADVGLTYGERDGELVPVLSGRPVQSPDDRREVFRASLGDRFAWLHLGTLLTASSAELRRQIGSAQVLARRWPAAPAGTGMRSAQRSPPRLPALPLGTDDTLAELDPLHHGDGQQREPEDHAPVGQRRSGRVQQTL